MCNFGYFPLYSKMYSWLRMLLSRVLVIMILVWPALKSTWQS